MSRGGDFAKAIAFAWWPILAIFGIIGVFWAAFCTQQLECASRVVFWMFLRILFFERKWRFCEGYSLCMVTSHFGNVVIFRILGFLWSCFLHTTNQTCFYSCFLHTFDNFNFWAKRGDLAKAWWPILAILEIFSFFKVLGASWNGFLHTTTVMCS